MTIVPLWCFSPRWIFKLTLGKSIKHVPDLQETIQLYEARLNAWYEKGHEVPCFKSGPLSNLGLKGPPFQPLNIIVCRRFEPSFFRQLPLLWPSLLFRYIFSKPLTLARLWQYHPNEIQNKNKNKLRW